MANGDFAVKKDRLAHVLLLDAVGAVNDGVWIDTYGYDQVSIQVNGITTATVKIHGSNKLTIPANTAHEVERVSLTADGEVIYDVLPRWMKARVSAWTAGVISVIAVFRLSGGQKYYEQSQSNQ